MITLKLSADWEQVQGDLMQRRTWFNRFCLRVERKKQDRLWWEKQVLADGSKFEIRKMSASQESQSGDYRNQGSTDAHKQNTQTTPQNPCKCGNDYDYCALRLHYILYWGACSTSKIGALPKNPIF